MTYGAYLKYESYSDSGVDWLDEIPSHWSVKRAGFLLEEVNEKSKNGSEPLLSLSKSRGVLRRDSMAERGGQAESLIGYKHVAPGDIVINRMQAANGLLSVSNISGITSPDYAIFRAKEKTAIRSDLVAALLQQPAYQGEIKRRVKGVMEGFIRLYSDDLFRLPLICPPKGEQRAIAAFLDEKCEGVDEAVRIKEVQIALLREWRQILIQQAVTRGLNPNAPMKDSGIDWIGQIPAHWEVRSLKHLLSQPLKYGANEEAKLCVDGDPRYIRITDFGVDGNLRADTKRTLPEKIARDYLLKNGDILLARSGATVGKAYLFSEEIRACFAGYLIMARPDTSKIISKYLDFCFRSSYFEHWKEMFFSRATIQNIGADKYSAFLLPLPPIHEQRAILSYMDEESQKLDAAISIKQEQIAALKEYKTSLINATVTGKIKVI